MTSSSSDILPHQTRTCDDVYNNGVCNDNNDEEEDDDDDCSWGDSEFESDVEGLSTYFQ